MEMLIGLIGLAVLIVVYVRRFLLRRETPPLQAATFDGEIFKVGKAAIARRAGTDTKSSVVVVHGFAENFTYFSRYYAAPHLELIKLSCADYHLPVENPNYVAAEWTFVPKHQPGTIAYDAAVLNLAIEHLVSHSSLRVHGHSRGGAVVLEAARQRPDLFVDAEVILEAPMLPQARPVQQISPIIAWLLPFYLAAWQQQPISDKNRSRWGSLEDPHKRDLVMGFPFNARHLSTMVTNIQDMADWTASTGPDIYRHVRCGAVLVPAEDRILDTASMRVSAQQAENLQVIEIENGSHFVIHDHPSSVPPVLQA
ncbi:alpha/beta fold hydrolase [Pseudomonas sp. OIL-1]|uniref:alpha/beta fold hydrolase n=1 Tax=Pseudomonas sp. OIL-1 TaxID=2706126 RepID=UPI0013A77D82|nr:alpha/beta hydrolase [Pseudomonas sp. OIL-1]QIB50485.1 alpha/beta hydrolase [Pseudomonas sp. OIL-1]